MNDIIARHRGIISDVARDGTPFLFGVMEDSLNPVMDAVNAVQDMQKALIP
jgi:hypothetical protein